MSIIIPSCRISLEALESGTKTSTALTAPYPTVHFAFDGGFERALFGLKAARWTGLDIFVVDYKPDLKPDKDLWRGHDITVFRLPRPIQTDPIRKLGFTQLWNYFNNRIALAAGDREYLKSVTVDTMTLARETRADAHLQAYQERIPAGGQMRESLIQIEYGVINDAIKDILLNFEGTGINLLALHHLVDEYVDTPVTDSKGNVKIENLLSGRQILRGYNKTYQYVDMALRLELKQDKDKKASSQATFMKSGYNPNLLGTTIPNMTWNSLMSWVELSLGNNVVLPKSQIEAEVPV